MNFFKAQKTRVVGHRGSPFGALENTVESFDRAEAEGADGFELDVRLTLDGEAVVHHDAELLLEDRRVPIASLTLPELLAVTLVRGEWRGGVATLRDVLQRYGPHGRYLIEMKAGPSPKAGLLELRVAALLTQLNLLERSVVLSFSADLLRRIKEIQPAIETALSFDVTTYRPVGRMWPDLPPLCGGLAPHFSLVSERLFAEAREAELDIHPWTVNEPELAAHLATLGAASVITDVPALVGPAIRAVTGLAAPLSLLREETSAAPHTSPI